MPSIVGQRQYVDYDVGFSNHGREPVTARVRLNIVHLLGSAAPAKYSETLASQIAGEFTTEFAKADKRYRCVPRQRRRDELPLGTSRQSLEFMESSMVSINGSFCVVDQRARKGWMDEPRQGDMGREAGGIQLIDAGAQRQDRAEIDEPFESVVGNSPNQGDVDLF